MGRAYSFRFLRFHITEDLTWTHHTNIITNSSSPLQTQEAQRGERRHLNSIRSITGGLVRTAQNISRGDLPSMEGLWTAGTSPDGSKQMTLRLFQLLLSGPQHEALTTTLRNIFIQQKKSPIGWPQRIYLHIFAYPVIRSVLQGELSDDGWYYVLAL